MTDNYLYHITDDISGTLPACAQRRYGMITLDENKVNCATCKSIIEQRKIEKANEEFDNQLWTFTAVRQDGSESVLYGHATNNVFVFALAKASAEDSWLKVTKYVPSTFTCDFYGCSGLHPSRENYCSSVRRYAASVNSTSIDV